MDYSRALKLASRIPGGTGVTPVKSGVPPDFARAETARTFPGSSRNDRLTISGATPEMAGWKPAPPRRRIIGIDQDRAVGPVEPWNSECGTRSAECRK
jgi:hypothetical protein